MSVLDDHLRSRAEREADKDARIAELTAALKLARPYLAAQLQQLAHVCGDPVVAGARNDLVQIDRALAAVGEKK